MEKTTVYLPRELKEALKRTARTRGMSEAELVREGVATVVRAERPRPRGGLFASDDVIADRVDELLEGFGED